MTRAHVAAPVLASLLALAGCGGGSDGDGNGNPPPPNTIRVVSDRFIPPTLTVAPGTTVTFQFEAAGHTVTSGTGCVPNGQFCSPNDASCNAAPLSTAGQVYTRTFTAAGTFPFFCQPHCLMGMTGTIVVQ